MFNLDYFGGATARALGDALGFTEFEHSKLAGTKVSITRIRMLSRARRSILGIKSAWHRELLR